MLGVEQTFLGRIPWNFEVWVLQTWDQWIPISIFFAMGELSRIDFLSGKPEAAHDRFG